MNDWFYNNLTITFSGFNICKHIKLAVESFLELYPYLKNNIVVFDDDSTDDTREYLENHGIKRITWTASYRKYLNDYSNRFFDCMCYRNNVALHDILCQVNTKYVLINDGDVVFLKPFLEEYKKQILHYRALVVLSSLQKDLFTNPKLDYYATKLSKYRILFEPASSSFRVKGNEHRVNWNNYTILDDCGCPYPIKVSFFRVHMFHGLLDLHYFKSINLLFDTIENQDYLDLLGSTKINSISECGPVLDGGLDFHYELKSKNIPYYPLSYWEDLNKFHLYHFGFKSSMERIKVYRDVKSISSDLSNERLDFYLDHTEGLKGTLKRHNFI